ncbi:unnamed protein product, partial [marine sediment metagenome]
MVNLNNCLLKHTSYAAILVIFGVVIKNSFEQMKMPNHPVGKPLGMALFTLGWIYTAYILSYKRKNKALFVLSSLGVLVAVMAMKEYMSKKKAVPMFFPILFAVSWIALGYGVGQQLTGNMKHFGLLASLLVLISMMRMLPTQRAGCIVDGPGMPLFVI